MGGPAGAVVCGTRVVDALGALGAGVLGAGVLGAVDLEVGVELGEDVVDVLVLVDGVEVVELEEVLEGACVVDGALVSGPTSVPPESLAFGSSVTG